jgi:hypothetical protein
MTAPVAQSQFATTASHASREIAAMWRGAAIDIFAALEAMAIDWLHELDATKDPRVRSQDFVAWHRFKRLGMLIGDAKFAPYNAKVMRLLAAPHGRMRATGQGVTLSWRAVDKGVWTPRDQTLSWIEAVGTLHRLTKLKSDLASQLGQVRRHCFKPRKSEN